MQNQIIDEQAIRDQAAKDGITHISTGVAIVQDGKILITRRAAGDFLGGTYELPGGGVDKGETITEGAIREVKEETGLTVAKVLGTFDGFDYSTDRKPHVRQINFLVIAEPGAIALDPEEHDTFEWISVSDISGIKMTDSMQQCVKDAFATLDQIYKLQ